MNKLLLDKSMVVTPQKTMAAGTDLEPKREDVQTEVKKDHHHFHSLSYFGLPYQDHNYGAPPPPTPPQSPPHCTEVKPSTIFIEPDKPPAIIDDAKKEEESSSEDKDEEEDDKDGSSKDEGITRCICDYEHDDGYMICCDKCLVWQHVECMGLDRSNIPDNYFCEQCQPRPVDVETAKALQTKKKKHLEALQKEEKGGGLGQEGTLALKTKKKVKKKKRKKDKEKDKDKEKEDQEKKKSDKKKKKKDKEKDEPSLPDQTAAEALLAMSVPQDNKNGDYQEAASIHCMPEVKRLMDKHRRNPEVFLAGAATYHGSHEEIIRKKACVGSVGKAGTGIISLEQIPANQPIMEMAGTLSLKDNSKSSNHHSRQLEPFMFVYSSFCDTELALDASTHGNICQFTRKSCSPNAEIRHMISDGMVQLYLFALKDIGSNTEITLGLDFDFTVGPHPVKCACGKKSCQVRKFWHKQKSNGIKAKDTNGEEAPKVKTPTKKTISPLKLSLNRQASVETPKKDVEKTPDKQQQTEMKSKSEPPTPRPSTEADPLSPVTKPGHKMTREERKMDAIMKAFEKMEKMQQRRQQTLDRLAQEKERRPSGDDGDDNPPKGGGGDSGGLQEQYGGTERSVKEGGVKEEGVKEGDGGGNAEELNRETAAGEETLKEEKEDESNDVEVTDQDDQQTLDSTLLPLLTFKEVRRPKSKSQRKRKKASKKRNRNSSGASSASVSVDVSSADDESNQAPATGSTTPSNSYSSPPCPSTNVSASSLPSTPLTVQTSFNGSGENSMDTVFLTSPAANSKHFKFPKTKRFFMNEWLNEKAAEASADSPLTVKTEPFEPVASATHSPNAAAVKERATSLDVSFGSAKKRWLRQAMQETSQGTTDCDSNSPVWNGAASPVMSSSQHQLQGCSPAVSPNTNSMDFMTPLKKRMLRHSLAEERPSQQLSPRPEPTLESTKTAPVVVQQTEANPSVNTKVHVDDQNAEDSETEGVRKTSSVDSGLSVTTPAELQRSPPTFPPGLVDGKTGGLDAVRKLDLGQEEEKVTATPAASESGNGEEERKNDTATNDETAKRDKLTERDDDSAIKEDLTKTEVTKEDPEAADVSPATSVGECTPSEGDGSAPATGAVVGSAAGSVVVVTDLGGADGSDAAKDTDDRCKPNQEVKKVAAAALPKTPEAQCAPAHCDPASNQTFKRSLSDDTVFNDGEINPVYFTPKKRHLYLRQNTDPGKRPLAAGGDKQFGSSWPRHEFNRTNNQETLPMLAEEGMDSSSLSSSWPRPVEKILRIPDEGSTDGIPIVEAKMGPTVGQLNSNLPVNTQVPSPPISSVPIRTDSALSASDVHPKPIGFAPPVAGSPIATPSGLPIDPRIKSPIGPVVVPHGLDYPNMEHMHHQLEPRYSPLDARPGHDGSPPALVPPHHQDPRLRTSDDGPRIPYPFEDSKLLQLHHIMGPEIAMDGSVSAPTTPLKKKVSLGEYRKRKSVSATKRPPEKSPVELAENDEPKATTATGAGASPTGTGSAGSSPDKTGKPANVITFQDKKLTDVDVRAVDAGDGLQNLPLFTAAATTAGAASPDATEGKTLTLSDEAHKLITSLTQVLMEGKQKALRQNVDPLHPNEDPLQRMRRELNEKNMEKVLALKRAHSPEPPPPPPEKKSRLEVGSPTVPPPPPPRNVPSYGINSPKAGGLQRQTNPVVAGIVNPQPGVVLAVPQMAPQTNGGAAHVVFPTVLHAATNPPPPPPAPPPVVGPYQQPIVGKHQVHSPRGQSHYSPIAATSTSPRGIGGGGSGAPHVGHGPPTHPSSFQFQTSKHTEDPPLVLLPGQHQPVPHQPAPHQPAPHQPAQYQNYNGDQGNFHVNGDVGATRPFRGKSLYRRSSRDGSGSRKVSSSGDVDRQSGGAYPSGKYQHDKRSQSQSPYGRSGHGLSPRRSYHRN